MLAPCDGIARGARTTAPGPLGATGFNTLAPRSGNQFVMTMSGYFTMLKYLDDLRVDVLERSVGFEVGRLAAGFRVLILSPGDLIGKDEFSLNASTRWSGGDVGNAVRKPDESALEALLVARDQDVDLLKSKVAGYFAKRGGNTPVKVVPNLDDCAGTRYPDGMALRFGQRSGVPQFTLKKGIHKQALVLWKQ